MPASKFPHRKNLKGTKYYKETNEKPNAHVDFVNLGLDGTIYYSSMCESADRIHLAQDRIQWQLFIKVVVVVSIYQRLDCLQISVQIII
jgi:hypothetical protein